MIFVSWNASPRRSARSGARGSRKPKTCRQRQSHRAGHAITIFREPVECGIRRDRQVHLRARESDRGNSASEFRNARSCRRAREESAWPSVRLRNRFIEHGAPASQPAPLRFEIARLVRHVVDQAHERVERAKRVALLLAQSEKRQIEAAVRRARDAIALRIGRANRIRSRDAGCVRNARAELHRTRFGSSRYAAKRAISRDAAARANARRISARPSKPKLRPLSKARDDARACCSPTLRSHRERPARRG